LQESYKHTIIVYSILSLNPDIQYILQLFTPEEAAMLTSFIAKNYVSEKQLLQIARKTFQIDVTKPDQLNKINAQKMFLMLSFVINSDIKKADGNGFNNLIKRLMKNGENEVKEIFAHNFLSKLFEDYFVLPLFANVPDGIILIEKEKKLPVEIKTRNPEILNNLQKLFDFICESFENVIPEDKLITCNITINRIEKSCNEEVLNEEKHDLHMLLDKIKTSSIPFYPMIFSAVRESMNIEMKIEMTSLLQEPQPHFSMTEKLVNDCICYKGYTSCRSGQFFGGMHLALTCSDAVKRQLSKQVVEKCLKAKNIPEEGIIVIYFDALTNEHLGSFIETTAMNYVKTRKNIAILGIKDQFDLQKKQIIGKMLAVGDDIKEQIARKQKHAIGGL